MRITFCVEFFENLLPPQYDSIPQPGMAVELADGRVVYEALLPAVAAPLCTDFLLGQDTDPGTAVVRALWQRAHGAPGFIAAGMFTLNNVWLVGTEALVLDPASGLCLVGPALNWSIDRLRWYLSTSLPAELELRVSADSREFSFVVPDRMAELPADALLLSTPGWGIYGHWLFDFPGRLMLAEAMAPAASPYLINDLRVWMKPFLQAFHIDQARMLVTGAQPIQRVSKAFLPSGTKSGFALGEPLHRLGWHRLRSGMLAQPASDARPPSERIFVTRRQWGSQRNIDNMRAMEGMAEARGYALVAPETLSVPAQARLFRGARIIVGEDGSGLHNIVFAERGAKLGVVGTPERLNLWHAGLCSQLGHKLGYLLSSPLMDDQRFVDADAFAALLDLLEAQ